MPNKHTRTIDSTLLDSKLAELSSILENIRQTKEIQTTQGLVSASHNLLNSFYKKLSMPFFEPADIVPDQAPLSKDYNENSDSISTDLSIIFSELENIEGLVLSNFNFISSRAAKLQARVKSIASKLGDYVL